MGKNNTNNFIVRTTYAGTGKFRGLTEIMTTTELHNYVKNVNKKRSLIDNVLITPTNKTKL